MSNGVKTSNGNIPKTWARLILLFMFLGLASGALWLNNGGHGLGRISGEQTVAYFLAIVFLAAGAYELIALAIGVGIRLRGGSAGEVTMLVSFTRVLLAISIIVTLLYSTGTLTRIGTIVGAFAGLLLGWSLQAPVSGIAAWVMITIKRPFRVGDRVLFPTLALLGDVLNVGLMYTKLMQVGGSVGSEEANGRHILIPNAMLFSQVAINYTPQQQAPYFLDEVIIRLTYDSDWDKAERILLSVAREVTAPIIAETGKDPYIRSDIFDYGIYMRLRYMTMAVDRPRVAHEIVKRIFREFQKTKDVDFAIPYVYSYRKGMEMPTRSGAATAPPSDIAMDSIVDTEAEMTLSEEEAAAVEALAIRIQQMGLLQPIIVQRMATGNFRLLAGRLRYLACRKLGWRVIPAIVKEPDVPWYGREPV